MQVATRYPVLRIERQRSSVLRHGGWGVACDEREVEVEVERGRRGGKSREIAFKYRSHERREACIEGREDK